MVHFNNGANESACFVTLSGYVHETRKQHEKWVGAATYV
jgi:hypothetical protein